MVVAGTIVHSLGMRVNAPPYKMVAGLAWLCRKDHLRITNTAPMFHSHGTVVCEEACMPCRAVPRLMRRVQKHRGVSLDMQ